MEYMQVDLNGYGDFIIATDIKLVTASWTKEIHVFMRSRMVFRFTVRVLSSGEVSLKQR